jgi:hypothetical protein
MTLLTGLSGFFRTTSQRGMAPLAEGFWRSQEPFAALCLRTKQLTGGFLESARNRKLAFPGNLKLP